jgi:hypothetical protein
VSWEAAIGRLPPISFVEERTRAPADLPAMVDTIRDMADHPVAIAAAERLLDELLEDGACPRWCEPLKAQHNHVFMFEADGHGYVAKVYGQPSAGLREALGRGFAALRGVPSVRPPLGLAVRVHGERVVVCTVFARSHGRTVHLDDPEVPNRLAWARGRALGAWARRFHDAAPDGVASTTLRLRDNHMFDLSPLPALGLVDDELLDRVEAVSRRWLAWLGDDGRALVHNDLATPGNVYWSLTGTSIQEVVDHEFVQIGFRCTELLWIHALGRPAVYLGFLKGYRWCGPDPAPLLSLWGRLYGAIEALAHVYLDPPPLPGARVDYGPPNEARARRALADLPHALDVLEGRHACSTI